MKTVASPSTNILNADLDELLDIAPSPWEKLRGARIFLTGGTGLFGRWMLESLLWANDRLALKTSVTVLARDPKRWQQTAPHLAGHPAVDICRGDILRSTLPNEKFSHVLHMAAPSGPDQAADPLKLFNVLIHGTERVLDLAVRSGAGRFLYVSSGAVYGRHAKAMSVVEENCREAPDQMDPASCYDEGKRAAELLCALYWQQKQLPCVVARCFSVLGPFLPLDWHYAAGNFIRDALAGGPIKVNGDGTPERSYLYLADLAWWLWVILVHGQPGRAYNAGSDEAVSIAELARRTAACFTPPLPIHVARAAEAGRTPQRQVPCIRKAGEKLGLYARVRLDEALRRTLAWHNLVNLTKSSRSYSG
ncbi:MAG: NAD-dependent epimerase/dehydratase family protein [Deltaproteobacteria bacterium]|jgi:dTDP-glucose 4,6-dehydratase|nr:NAD-dependent epimerase/dehydratase family protein [Deltaproteobacteria bacterium]